MPLIFEGLFSCQGVANWLKCCLTPNSNFNMNAQYLYFNDISGEWEQTTLEELATIDNEAAIICPVNEDGTPGKQITFGELLKQNAKKSTPQKHEKQPTPPPAPVTPPAPIINLTPKLENTLIYTCRLFVFFFWLSYYAGAIVIATSLHIAQGIIVLGFALLVHVVLVSHLKLDLKIEKKQ